MQRRPSSGHPGLLMLEPGVEPLELERIDVDRRAVEVLPGTVDQLIAPCRPLAGQHGRGRAAAIPRVLELGVVDRFAVLEDVELASDQVGGDVVGDDPRQDVLRVAGLPIRAVVGLIAARQDVFGHRRVIAGQPVDVVGLDRGEIGEQGRIAGRVSNRVGRVLGSGEPQVGLAELEVEHSAHERRVPVYVVCADHREGGLQRRMPADGAREQQLIDPQVRRPVGADPPVGLRQTRSPMEHPDRVLLLDGVKEPPAAVGVAGAAHVLDHLDVPALSQIIVSPTGGRATGR